MNVLPQKKNIKPFIILLITVVLIYGVTQLGWKLFGFSQCTQAEEILIQSVEVGAGEALIIGRLEDDVRKENPQISFSGYTAKTEGDTLYIGVKYSGFLYFLRSTKDFRVVVPFDNSTIKRISLRDADSSKVIWSK